MRFVPELSVNLPAGLMRDLVKAARGDVSAFVAEAVRKELAHRHLSEVIDRMGEHLGPEDEAQVDMFRAMIREVNGANGKGGEE
jgi:hypothetical protein